MSFLSRPPPAQTPLASAPRPRTRALRCWAALLCLAGAPCALPAWAAACDGAQRIRLHTPVVLEAQQLAQLRALPPLRVVALDAPPLAIYDEHRGTYTGIGPDVLCFMSQQIGLRYEFVAAPGVPVPDKIRQVQRGEADLLLPLSHLPERERLGLFTRPYHDSHYAVIASKGRRLQLTQAADLAGYRVGFVDGVALAPTLQALVPASRLQAYAQSVAPGGLFQALREGTIDVAVFNNTIFAEHRYRHELFDLQVVHVLREYPRAYRFYLTHTPRHEALVAAFDQYLAAIDTSASLALHEDEGERRLIERYVRQRSQRAWLQATSVAGALLAAAALVALLQYRRLAHRLASSTRRILQQQQELLEANRKLAQLSQTDGLTGLANRRHFDHALAREHAHHRRYGTVLSVLLIDLDHFKRVNDRFGHAVGDECLRAVAAVLADSTARATDLAARYGGEEFTCLLPDTGLEHALLMAERIRVGVAGLQMPETPAGRPELKVSIGVATLAGGDHDAQALVREADRMLYAAKHAGRNRVCSSQLA